MTYRPEFSPATKRQALEAAGYRCQDPLCGKSPEWGELLAKLEKIFNVGLPAAWRFPLNLQEVTDFRDALMEARFKHRALKPIIKRFKLDGGALLEVDHAQECADGGDNAIGNAVVRCVFCHYFKTQVRANSRRRAPKKQARTFPEQLDVIKTAKVEGLRALVKEKTAGAGVNPSSVASGRSPYGPNARTVAQPRRHTSERQFQEAVQRREAAIEDNWFGV